MSDQEEKDSDIVQVNRALDVLAEHFDSVQIFCTRHDASTKDAKTVSVNMGRGNWFSRYGQVREWIICKDEEIRFGVKEDQ